MRPFSAIIVLYLAALLACPSSLAATVKREDDEEKKMTCRNTHTVFSENTDGWKAYGSPKGTFELTSDGLEMRLLKPEKPVERLIDKETELPYNSDAGVGPTFNSTTYMHYGKFTAVAKAAPKGGAVTAFILIADNRDEIDFEFTGGAPHTAQTNFFWGERPEYTVNGASHQVPGGSVYDEFHTYTIHWTPERIVWYIDDKQVRIQEKKKTCKDGVCKYPSHPARVQVGLWDGSFEYGTAEWAKGPIDWDGVKHISAYLKEVRIECDPDYNEIVE
ncbi:hypothetical protein VTP01DRAFT_10187 [Rhizomucor pusillus]|uniref:uncharacterized protein n=1 Tax=Rhizomucor pusillus TaxID=4840 RepID=UPI003743706E